MYRLNKLCVEFQKGVIILLYKFSQFGFLTENENYKHWFFNQKILCACYKFNENGAEYELRIIIPRTKNGEVNICLMVNQNPQSAFDWEPVERQPSLKQLPEWFQEYFIKAQEIFHHI
jgi:hypothetical protein